MVAENERFGPNTAQVEAIIARAGRLTPDEIDAASDERDAAWDAARFAARDAAREAAREAAWFAARDAAWFAKRAASWAAAWAASWAASWAAAAAVVADLVGQYGLTQDHLDTLTGPWRRMTGTTEKGESA